MLWKVLDEYQDSTKSDANPNRYKRYAERLEAFQSGEEGTYFPVYYDNLIEDAQGNTLIFLSPASKTREIYRNKISNMVGMNVPNNVFANCICMLYNASIIVYQL